MCDVNSNFPKGDVLDITIEEDGTITINTAGISGDIHKTAEEFLSLAAETLGAKIETVQHKPAHQHVHHSHNNLQKIGR